MKAATVTATNAMQPSEGDRPTNGVLGVLGAVLRCLVVSLGFHAAVLGALKIATETLTRGNPNASAILVAFVGFLWFGSHAVLLTRVGERALGAGRRGTAIGITVGITGIELAIAFGAAVVHAYTTWQR
jgi:hypothetical protein